MKQLFCDTEKTGGEKPVDVSVRVRAADDDRFDRRERAGLPGIRDVRLTSNGDVNHYAVDYAALAANTAPEGTCRHLEGEPFAPAFQWAAPEYRAAQIPRNVGGAEALARWARPCPGRGDGTDSSFGGALPRVAERSGRV